MEPINVKDLIELFIATIALIISLIALYYTVITVHLKRGQFLRYTLTTTSTIECQDKYISSITIENLKDKASVIFKIYIQIGYNILVEIDTFEDSPLIINPYSVFSKNYDPIIYYSCGLNQVKLNDFLGERNAIFKMKVVLSTSEGKVYPKHNKKMWNPIADYFNNYYLQLVEPIRLTYKGKSYGSNVKYLIDLEFKNGENQVAPILNSTQQIIKFKEFEINDCANMDIAQIKALFREQKKRKVIEWKKVVVIDIQSEIAKSKTHVNRETIQLQKLNFIQYFILGKIYTLWDNFKTNRSNRKLARQRKIKSILK